jgi:hypothetical protein
VKQYLNITTKSKFQGSIGFVCETPLFHKTRPGGAAGKRREGSNSGPRRVGLRLGEGEEWAARPASSPAALAVRPLAPAGVRGFSRGH